MDILAGALKKEASMRSLDMPVLIYVFINVFLLTLVFP